MRPCLVDLNKAGVSRLVFPDGSTVDVSYETALYQVRLLQVSPPGVPPVPGGGHSSVNRRGHGVDQPGTLPHASAADGPRTGVCKPDPVVGTAAPVRTFEGGIQ